MCNPFPLENIIVSVLIKWVYDADHREKIYPRSSGLNMLIPKTRQNVIYLQKIGFTRFQCLCLNLYSSIFSDYEIALTSVKTFL